MSVDSIEKQKPIKPSSLERSFTGGYIDLPPLPPLEQALYELSSLPADRTDELLGELNQEIDEIISLELDAGRRAILERAANILRWTWFGKRGELPPERLTFDKSLGSSRLSTEDDGSLVSSAVRYLKVHVSDRVYDPITYTSHPYSRDKRSIFESLIRGSEVFQVLEAVLTRQPQSGERPLTPYERSVKASAAEDIARRSLGLTPQDEPRIHDPDGIIQKSSWRIDEETRRKTLIKEDEPAELLHQVFEQALVSHLRREYPDIDLKGSQVIWPKAPWYKDSVLVEFANTDKIFSIEDPVKVIAAEIASESTMGMLVESDNLISQLLDRTTGSSPPIEDGERILDAASENLSLLCQAKFYAVNSRIWNAYLRGIEVDEELALRGQQEAMRVEDWDKQRSSQATVISQEILNELELEEMGIVKGGALKGPNRIIELYPLSSPTIEVTLPPSGYDLWVSIHNDSFGDRMPGLQARNVTPSVPGYRLTAIHKDIDGVSYYFNQEFEDPYDEPSGINITKDRLEDLSNQLIEAGMTGLAERLLKFDTISLAQLVRLLKANGNYTYDSRFDSQYAHQVFLDSEPSISDFAGLIEGDQLNVQCTGAAIFLKSVLSVAIPAAKTKIISGLVVKNGDHVISNAGHAQLLFSFQGHQYILDATPSNGSSDAVSEIGGSAVRRLLGGIFNRPKPPSMSNVSPLEEGTAKPLSLNSLQEVYTEGENPEKQLAVISQRLERFAEALFKIKGNHPNQLKLRLVDLGMERDPVSRVYGLVDSAKRNELNAKELSSTKAYLQNLQSFSPEEMKQAGIRVNYYESGIIDSLLGYLNELEGVIDTNR